MARAQGESQTKELLGRGEASRIAQVGQAEANVNRQKIQAYGDPRLFALNLLGDQLSRSAQPLVPERLMVLGGDEQNGKGVQDTQGLLTTLLGLLVSEKSGLNLAAGAPVETKTSDAAKEPANQSTAENEKDRGI